MRSHQITVLLNHCFIVYITRLMLLDKVQFNLTVFPLNSVTASDVSSINSMALFIIHLLIYLQTLTDKRSLVLAIRLK